MAINIGNVECRKSTKAVSNDGLGNSMSATNIISQTAAYDAAGIGGVTIKNSYGNTIGSGSLSYVNSTDTLTWAGNGESTGGAIDVSSDGDYAIPSSGGGDLVVTVVSASLPGVDTNDGVTIAAKANEIFDDITAAESLAGDVEYRCIYIRNAHATGPMVGCKYWINADASGDDTLKVGLDTNGVGTGGSGSALSIADESTAPVGVTFVTAVDVANAIDLGTLAAGQAYPVWIERTIGADSVGGNQTSSSVFGIRANF